MRFGTTTKPHDDDGWVDDDGPTQLRQQSYVEQRPGAYWAGPDVSTVRAADPDSPTHETATYEPEQAAASLSRDAPHSREPDAVMLEAEPVLSILVDATPIPIELPTTAQEPTGRRRRRLPRRIILILFAIVAIVAGTVALAVGITLATSPNRNSAPGGGGGSEALSERPAPSLPPTASPSRAPASAGGGPPAPIDDDQPPPALVPATATPSVAPRTSTTPSPSPSPSPVPTTARPSQEPSTATPSQGPDGSATGELDIQDCIKLQAMKFLECFSDKNLSESDCYSCANCTSGIVTCDDACSSACGGCC